MLHSGVNVRALASWSSREFERLGDDEALTSPESGLCRGEASKCRQARSRKRRELNDGILASLLSVLLSVRPDSFVLLFRTNILVEVTSVSKVPISLSRLQWISPNAVLWFLTHRSTMNWIQEVTTVCGQDIFLLWQARCQYRVLRLRMRVLRPSQQCAGTGQKEWLNRDTNWRTWF